MTKRQRRIMRTEQRHTQKKQRHMRTKPRRMANEVRQSQPHDSFFKKVFKRPEYCRALMKIVLNPRHFALFNWALLKIHESVTTGSRGEERRADIVIEVPLLNKKFPVIFTVILEHKSYRDNNAVVQMLGYYNEIAQQTGGIILPIIITCCKDKQATIPSDYLSWALRQQGAPEELKRHFRQLPNFRCLVVSLHDLSYRRLRRGGEAVCLALFGMRSYWEMGEDVVYEIIKKARLLPEEERAFVLSMLMDYYECADNGYGMKGFNMVERKRFPHLKEEDRIVPDMEFGLDRAKKEGMQQGLRKGKQQGKQLGIEQGKLEMVKRFLLAGFDEQEVCKAAQLSRQELAQIKRSLD